MAGVCDRWERLVRATLRREQLRLCGQRTPSDLSSASSSSSFNFSVPSSRLSSRSFTSILSGKTFEYDEILRVTNYFSPSNLIKHGRSGDLFRGVLENGTRVIIKRIDLSSAKKELRCISELKVQGKLSGCRLLAPLQGHCFENWDEKYLVYEYMPNRDLSSSFYSKIVPDEYLFPSENWRTRVRVATGLAEALSYLHHQCVPPLVHRDIQASSILLDDKFEVRLCSLGDVCAQEKESNQTRITGFLCLPRGSNQVPTGTFNATCAYDVYCFGKVLLELVKGTLAATPYSSIMNDLMNKNPHITLQHEDCIARIIDPTLTKGMDEWKEATATAVIAKACLNPEPSKRPLMAHVLMALKNPLKVVIAEDMASDSLLVAGPPGLVGAAYPKRSKLSRLVSGTWLRTSD